MHGPIQGMRLRIETTHDAGHLRHLGENAAGLNLRTVQQIHPQPYSQSPVQNHLWAVELEPLNTEP